MLELYERDDSPYWYAKFDVGEVTLRKSTGVAKGRSTKDQASKAAEQLQRNAGTEQVRARSVTLAQAWVLYAVANPSDNRQSTMDYYERLVAHVINHLGVDFTISELTTSVLQRCVKELKPTVSDIQLRRMLSAVSSVMEYAIDEEMEGAPEFNPRKLVRTKNLKDAVKKPRWLKVEEVRRLLVAADETWKLIILFFLETGMRREEVFGLMWDEVDFKQRVVTLGPLREKTARGRIIPLTSTAMSVLAKVARYPGSGYVFNSPKYRRRYIGPDWSWKKLRSAADLKSARIHDLRHTWASWTRHLGMAKDDRKQIAGHMSDDAHDRYSYASFELLVETMEKHSPSTLLTHQQKS